MLYTELLFTGALGAMLYGGLEMLWRGRTHWTMLLAGGICFSLMYIITTRSGWPLWTIWIVCALIITTVEFLFGVVVNLRLGWNVWDYSSRPLNLFGQVCPLFTIIWFFLSIPGTALCSLIQRRIF